MKKTCKSAFMMLDARKGHKCWNHDFMVFSPSIIVTFVKSSCTIFFWKTIILKCRNNVIFQIAWPGALSKGWNLENTKEYKGIYWSGKECHFKTAESFSRNRIMMSKTRLPCTTTIMDSWYLMLTAHWNRTYNTSRLRRQFLLEIGWKM